MKKAIIILVALLIAGLQAVLGQEVNFGTVRTDGYQKITKGAFWSKRPEARMVHNGSFPPGVEVVVLEQDYFVRFKDGENNGRDNNYIVFPKGEKVYYKSGHCFAAICGNEIEFMKPVKSVEIQQVVDSIYVDPLLHDSIYVYKYIYFLEKEEQPRYSDVVVVTAGYQPYYQQMQCSFNWQPMPLCNLWGGGDYGNNYITVNNIDNSYYNNQVTTTTNNIDNSTTINPRPRPRPNPTPDPGGPVDPEGGDNGGPVDPNGGSSVNGNTNTGGPVDTKSALAQNRFQPSSTSGRGTSSNGNQANSRSASSENRSSSTASTEKRGFSPDQYKNNYVPGQKRSNTSSSNTASRNGSSSNLKSSNTNTPSRSNISNNQPVNNRNNGYNSSQRNGSNNQSLSRNNTYQRSSFNTTNGRNNNTYASSRGNVNTGNFKSSGYSRGASYAPQRSSSPSMNRGNVSPSRSSGSGMSRGSSSSSRSSSMGGRGRR